MCYYFTSRDQKYKRQYFKQIPIYSVNMYSISFKPIWIVNLIDKESHQS